MDECNAINRRRFLKKALGGTALLSCADFLSYFLRFGLPSSDRASLMAGERVAEAQRASPPRFLIYWFLEGGWMGYDMFNPIVTDNNVLHRLPDVGRTGPRRLAADRHSKLGGHDHVRASRPEGRRITARPPYGAGPPSNSFANVRASTAFRIFSFVPSTSEKSV